MTLAYFRRLWENYFREHIAKRQWIGCDKDWRPAPYLGCTCNSCLLARELGAKETIR